MVITINGKQYDVIPNSIELTRNWVEGSEKMEHVVKFQTDDVAFQEKKFFYFITREEYEDIKDAVNQAIK